MKINTYENDNNISLNDKVTGTDADDANKTKNYTFQRIKDFLIAQGLGGGSSIDISGKEDTVNKSTNVATDGTSGTKYPTVKAVKTYVDSNVLPFKTYATNLRFMSDGSIDDTIIYSNLTGLLHTAFSGIGIYELISDTGAFTTNNTFISPFGYQGTTTNSGNIRLPIFNSNVLAGYYWAQRITASTIRLNFTNLSGDFVNPYSILVDRTLQLEIKVYN
jgi:hypothetical protein